MPRRRIHEEVQCRHFRFKLFQKSGTYWADGRSGNPVNVGRRSLQTPSYKDATRRLQELDEYLARETGLNESNRVNPSSSKLSLEEGRDLYESHAFRARSAGGVSKSSEKRYRAMMDNFVAFLHSRSVLFWNDVDNKILRDYLSHRERTVKCKPRTLYGEGTFVKQVVKYFIVEKMLPDASRLTLSVKKPRTSDRYCFTDEQVEAILAHCDEKDELRWMGQLLIVLAFTGMRIGEAATLRWSDVVLGVLPNDPGKITIRAEHAKNGETRHVPLMDRLAVLLASIPRHTDGVVFHGPRGGRLKTDTVRNVLRRDVIKPLSDQFPTPAGVIGFKDATPHSFRHFFCSFHVRKGTAERILRTWLGHRDSEMVAHYFHLNDAELQEAMARISKASHKNNWKD